MIDAIIIQQQQQRQRKQRQNASKNKTKGNAMFIKIRYVWGENDRKSDVILSVSSINKIEGAWLHYTDQRGCGDAIRPENMEDVLNRLAEFTI